MNQRIETVKEDIIEVISDSGRSVIWKDSHPALYGALIEGRAYYVGENKVGREACKDAPYYTTGEAPGDVDYFCLDPL